MDGGCGTSIHCTQCGAGKSIKKTKETLSPVQDECRITRNYNGREVAHDLFVYTRPIIINESTYVSYAIKDISNEKRRDALEQIFFHDVLNTAGAVSGIAQILPECDDKDDRLEMTETLISSSKQLVDEIITQRDIRSAEDLSSLTTVLQEMVSKFTLNSNSAIKEEHYFVSANGMLVNA